MKRMKYNGRILFSIIAIIGLISSACNILLPVDEGDYVDEKYDVASADISATANAITVDPTPILTWSAGKDIASIDLQICDDDDFKGTLIADETGLQSNSYELKKPLTEYGRYAWRVRARTKNGEVSNWHLFHFSYLEAETFDSFEVHDGTFSTLHDWKLYENNYYDEYPIIQSDYAYDGEYAVEMSGSAYMETTATLNSDSILSFYVMRTDNYGTLNVYVDNTSNKSISASSNVDFTTWTMLSFMLPKGTHTIRWSYSRNSSSEEYIYIDAICIIALPDVSNGFEEWDSSRATIDSISKTGSPAPYCDVTKSSRGENSILLPVPTSYSEDSCSVTAQINVTEDSILSFEYMTDYRYNNLRFSIDSEEELSSAYSMVNDLWYRYTCSLSPGIHSITWSTVSAFDSTSYHVWLDNIRVDAIPDFSFEGFEISGDIFSEDDGWYAGGAVDPALSAAKAKSGNNSAQITCEDDENFTVSKIINLTQESMFRFSYTKDSYINFQFYIDDEQKVYEISSTSGNWSDFNIKLEPGIHKLEWSFYNSYSASSSVWLDDITLTSIPAFTQTTAFEEWNGAAGTITSITRSGTDKPFIDSSTVQAGSYSVILTEDASNGDGAFQASVNFPQDSIVAFSYMQSGNSNGLYFRIDDTVKLSTSNSTSDWITVTYYISAGPHTLEWEHNKYYSYSGSAWIDNITAAAIPDFSNAFEEWDNTAGSYSALAQSGNTSPYVQPFTVNSGSYAAQLGPVSSYGESIFQADITVNADSVLSFDYLKDYYAYLYLIIDGSSETVSSYSTTVSSWTSYSRRLPAGTYTIKWRLYSNSSSSTERKGFVDNITLTPLPDFSNAFEEWDNTAGSFASLVSSGNPTPYIQTSKVNSGSYAAHLGPVSSSGESVFQADITVNTEAILSFDYLKDYYPYLYFVIDGTSYTIGSSYSTISNWTSYTRLLPAGTYTVKWRLYSSSSSEGTGFIDNISLSLPLDYAFAFEEWDNTAGSYASIAQSGDSTPYIQTATAGSGSYALHLGPVSSYGESIFQADITVDADSVLSFDFLKDYYAVLYLIVDGTSSTVSSYSTTVSSWTSHSRTLAAGTYTIKWRLYCYSSSSTERNGSVDNITLTPQ